MYTNSEFTEALNPLNNFSCWFSKEYFSGRDDACELNSVERYHPAKDEWTSVVAMNSRRSGVGLAVVNEKLYAVGG